MSDLITACTIGSLEARRCISRLAQDFASLVATLNDLYISPQESTSDPSNAQSPLLKLPSELRAEIYSAALLGTMPNLALLQTCRQINMEAQPQLYQRTVKFTSQTALFDWIEQGRSSNLKRVRHLELTLSDIDLTPLFDINDGKRHTRRSAWAMYQQELQRLDHALTALAGIRTLTVTPPRTTHSQLLKGMYLSLMAIIPQRYPKLEKLVVHDVPELLKKVPSLGELPAVEFTVPAAVKAESVIRPGGEDMRRQDSAVSITDSKVGKRKKTPTLRKGKTKTDRVAKSTSRDKRKAGSR